VSYDSFVRDRLPPAELLPDFILLDYPERLNCAAGLLKSGDPDALAVVQWLTCNDAAKLSVGQVQYSALTTPEGTFVDDILARWSKITGLTVVSQNGRGSRVPVTLHVSGVSEREALGLVLRDLSGYIMGERQDPQTGAIRIDRLVILTDSAAKPSDAGPPARRQPPPAAQAPPDQGEDVPRELAP